MNKKRLLIIFCICLPIFVLLLSYKMVLGFSSLGVDQKSTIDFLDDKEELKLNYTSNEVSHLEDVKEVMDFTDYLFYALLFAITLIITFYKKEKKFLKKLLKLGGITTIISVGVIGLFSLISFSSAFSAFHKIFFPQGNWQFATGSLLIRTFPLEFFIAISWKIFLLSLGMGLVVFLLSLRIKK